MKIKFLITLIIFLLILSIISVFGILNKISNNTTETKKEISQYILYKENVNNILRPDAIPPLESPDYISIEDAHFLNDNDKVFILEADESVYIFPQKIMVWHEVVNEYIDGESVSVTYCPLTGSVIGYKGDSTNQEDNTYGTSGSLLNSNLVLYDRNSDSLIPQILGVGIDSELEGITLNTIPVLWANWSDAKKAYPDSKVLSLKTGYQRDYFNDPYGSYEPNSIDSYYLSGAPKYEVLNDNNGAFSDKKVVIGVKFSNHVAAIDPDVVKKAGELIIDLGDNKLIAIYDNQLKSVRIYRSDDDGTILSEPVTFFDVMWFAWYAYYPDTQVIR